MEWIESLPEMIIENMLFWRWFTEWALLMDIQIFSNQYFKNMKLGWGFYLATYFDFLKSLTDSHILICIIYLVLTKMIFAMTLPMTLTGNNFELGMD